MLFRSQSIELVSLSNQDGETMKNFEISDILSVIQGCTDADSHKMDIDMIKKYLWTGEQLYRRSCEIEKKIICYENNITRHYFHVKPLDDSQLENWHQYLDFVETQGDFDWVRNSLFPIMPLNGVVQSITFTYMYISGKHFFSS